MTYWFRPKRYGYGATPTTWQGWLLTLGFVALLVAIMQALEFGMAGTEAHLAGVAAAVVLAALFTLIAWKKTDGPWRWRWGSDGEER
jgi:membrane associated rhomboid family serine protease